MTGLILLAFVQVCLIVLLLFLFSKLVGMLRTGAPLIALRRPAIGKPAPRAEPALSSAAKPGDGRVIAFKLPLPRTRIAAAKRPAEVAPAEEGEINPRGRQRRLLTLSELEAASNRAAAQFPEDYYAEVEAHLEGLFQSYLDRATSLADYLEAVRMERAKTQAALRNAQVLIDTKLRDEVERAAAAIDWCLEWATGQLTVPADEIAA